MALADSSEARSCLSDAKSVNAFGDKIMTDRLNAPMDCVWIA